MQYNFDEQIDRTNTSCIKWDVRQGVFGNPDVLAMWVADMDFRSPQFVIDAIAQRMAHPVLGYTLRPDSYFEAIIEWVKRRNGWQLKSDWIAHCPGVVPGLNVAVLAFTKPDDRIVIQTPVYPPFFDAVTQNGRTLVECPLVQGPDRYTIDFDDLDRKFDGARAIILCNPHNPVGRVFDEEELRRIGELCLKHGVTIISDEIHSDIIMPPHKHLHIANLDERFANICATFMAPSKTFNLAGLSTAYAVISNTELRAKYLHVLEHQLHIGMGNIGGIVGLEAAYRNGDEWLDQLVAYINENANTLSRMLAERLPKVRCYKPEGTYLAWIDFSALGLDDDELERLLVHQAKVGFNSGSTFGKDGKGFRRINLACPRANVVEAIERMAKVL